MKKTIKQGILCALLLFAAVMAVVFLKKGSLTLVSKLPDTVTSADEITVSFSEDGVTEETGKEIRGHKLYVSCRSLHEGYTNMILYDSQGNVLTYYQIGVSAHGFIWEVGSGFFGGLTVIMGIVTAFFILLTAFMFRIFWDFRHVELYSYQTIYSIGLGLFVLSVTVVFLYLWIQMLRFPETYGGYYVSESVITAEFNFMIISLPFILFFSIAMVISNIALIRHEGKKLVNALGIISGVLLLGGWCLGVGLNLFLLDGFQGSATLNRVYQLISGGFCTVYMYFECMLLGSIICGLMAARQEPDPDRDFVVILGCRIREDGTPYPLLKGRIDRAVDFYRRQLEKTGRAPVLVASGGQGKDEICPEACTIKNYLLSQGIPEDHILLEDKSVSTSQNMAFSRKLIEKRHKDARTAFSTTNYHVFRSGILSRRAGFRPQGMGARTRWYFWPNAFMREVAGLLAAEKKQILLCLLILVIFYAAQILIMPI